MAYHRVHAVPVSIARNLNTYGPTVRRDDGRAVPTFVSQALRGEPITVHGDGSQTRRCATSTISSRGSGGCWSPTSRDP